MDKFLAGDIGALFADAPVTLTSGVQTTPCWVDEEDVVEETAGGQQLVRRTVARYRAGAITAPAIEAAVTLDSDSYGVRDVRLEGDGATVALILTRA